MLPLADLRRELRPTLRLAAPLALAELGWSVMGIVDTVMAGPLGPAALGAGILGNMIFYPLAMSFTGLLLGMDTLVAQAFGARELQDARHTLINGVWLAILLTPVTIVLTMAAIPAMAAVHVNEKVMAECVPYMRALLWGLLPLFLFTAFRRYLQAIDIVRPVTFVLVTANIINFAGNWFLIPMMGLEGSGYSTSLSRLYMALAMLAVVVRENAKPISWRPDWVRIRELVRLGLPATGQILLEGLVFGVVTVLAAKLDPVSLSAHGIAVQVIATTFMVPLGISSAAAVRVGQAVGRRDARGIVAAGWASLLLAGGFMSAAGVLLWVAPAFIIGRFIDNREVIAAGVVLLRIAAFFELFDGIQIVATGALRGLGETRTPMIAHLVGYWVVGMPVVWVLCFPLGWGAPGIWIGLSAALILIGAALAIVWKIRSSTAHW
jgi:MATE family multidrug resistance protein